MKKKKKKRKRKITRHSIRLIRADKMTHNHPLDLLQPLALGKLMSQLTSFMEPGEASFGTDIQCNR